MVAARVPCDVSDPWIRCEGEGSGWDLRVRPAPGGGGVWKSGNLEIWEFGDLGIWKSRKLGPLPPSKKNHKIKFHSAQHVDKVWISREKILLAPFGAISGHLSMDHKKYKNMYLFAAFLGGPMGPIHLVWAFAAIHPRLGNR